MKGWGIPWVIAMLFLAWWVLSSAPWIGGR
jgi:hypothetical protein